MILKKIKPRTPSQRNFIKIKSQDLLKTPLLKSKIFGIKTSSGRNNSGKLTISQKGGGHKKKYRKLEFLRKSCKTEIVTSIEYDPNRNAFIASSYDFMLKSYQYLIAPKTLKVGDIFYQKTMIQKMVHALRFTLKKAVEFMVTMLNLLKHNCILETMRLLAGQ